MARKGPRSILIIEARFYEDIADELARGAVEELEGRRIEYERIAVPGSLEIPLALSLAHDFYVCPDLVESGCDLGAACCDALVDDFSCLVEALVEVQLGDLCG